MQPTSTIQHANEQLASPQIAPTCPTSPTNALGAHEREEQALPSIELPPDADFYGDYLQKLKEITWRFEISLETYLMERGINRERKPISSWKTRIKSPDSMKEKLAKRGFEPTAENAVYAVHDAAGVRVICPLVDDVASVAQFIRELPCFEVVQDKDYILHPKPNGYRSYHMILARTSDSKLDPEATRLAATKAAIEAREVSLSQLIDHVNTTGALGGIEPESAEGQNSANESFEFGRRMCLEVQLRTIAMDSWASIEHELKYKKDVPNQDFLQAELKRCADEMAATDLSLQTIADLISEK